MCKISEKVCGNAQEAMATGQGKRAIAAAKGRGGVNGLLGMLDSIDRTNNEVRLPTTLKNIITSSRELHM